MPLLIILYILYIKIINQLIVNNNNKLAIIFQIKFKSLNITELTVIRITYFIYYKVALKGLLIN